VTFRTKVRIAWLEKMLARRLLNGRYHAVGLQQGTHGLDAGGHECAYQAEGLAITGFPNTDDPFSGRGCPKTA